MGGTALATTTSASSARPSGYGLSEKNFRKLCTFVYSVCGIKLTEKKRSMVDGRLRRRMRALDIADINDYCDFLLGGSAAAEPEVPYFIDAVTTNKTDFFREPAHYVFMQEHVMPAWAAEGRRGAKIWSAACSTGAEAYTTAMVVDDFFHGRFDYSILATDVSTDVLQKGYAGLFPRTMIDPIPEEFRKRYVLVPKNPARNEILISSALRSKVSFHRLNLMDDRYPFDRDHDIIFLRNVLIYFDRPTQDCVLAKLCDHLRPGGYLFLGHSESLAGAKLPLQMVANTIFRRK
ncbi:CheR family methyltransferase [Rhizomicrobium electricum]|nr:CheR family methyltransferase [Rhizomicrobium electricum]